MFSVNPDDSFMHFAKTLNASFLKSSLTIRSRKFLTEKPVLSLLIAPYISFNEKQTPFSITYPPSLLSRCLCTLSRLNHDSCFFRNLHRAAHSLHCLPSFWQPSIILYSYLLSTLKRSNGLVSVEKSFQSSPNLLLDDQEDENLRYANQMGNATQAFSQKHG